MRNVRRCSELMLLPLTVLLFIQGNASDFFIQNSDSNLYLDKDIDILSKTEEERKEILKSLQEEFLSLYSNNREQALYKTKDELIMSLKQVV